MNLNIYNPYVRHDIELMHYGVKGMKWGKHKALTYPLSIDEYSPAERMAMRAQSTGNGSPVVRKPTMPSGPVISRGYRSLAESISKKDDKKTSDSKTDKEEKKEESKDYKKSSSSSKKSSKKKGSGKKSSGSKKAKVETETTQQQTVEVEQPINVRRKTHVNYSIDTRLGTRSRPSGGGNIRMTDMRGNAVNGLSGGSLGSTSRPTSGRMKLTKEESDREYETEVANVRRQRATQKVLKTTVASTSTEKVQAGKDIADKVLKKKSK